MLPDYAKTSYRVAAYCLVKEEAQKEGFVWQENYYTELIAAEPSWELVNIYVDAVATRADHRSQFIQMMEDAKAGMIDIILVKSISRFARNAADCQRYIRELKTYGVEVRFELECISSTDPSADMLFSMFVEAQKEKPTELTF